MDINLSGVGNDTVTASGLQGILRVIAEAVFTDSRWEIEDVNVHPSGRLTMDLRWTNGMAGERGEITISVQESVTPQGPLTHKDSDGDIWTRQSDGSYRYGESRRRESLDSLIKDFGVYRG